MSKALPYPIFLPNKGPVLDKPDEFLGDVFSPRSRNMEFYNELLQGRGGLSKFMTTKLNGAVLAKTFHKSFAGLRTELFATPSDIYAADFTNSRFDILTPTYEVGKIMVTNASTKVYGGFEVDNCDTNPVGWVDGSAGDVVVSRETSDFKEGTASVKLVVGAGAVLEPLAYHDIASKNLTAYDSIGFWFKSTVALNAGDLQFMMDNTAACASPLETINFPAIAANTWTWVSLTIATPAALTAVISIGIKQAVDKGAMTLYIDQIVAGDWLDHLGAGDFIKIGAGSINTAATWYTIASVDTDTSLTLTAVYAETSAYQQSYVVRLIFQGDSGDIWSTQQFIDDALGPVVVFTNGVDTPVYYAGSGQCVAMSGFITDFVSAKYVSSFKGRLAFDWLVLAGGNEPTAQCISDVFNILSWDDLLIRFFNEENADEIRGACVFGGYHVVFKENEAYIGRFTGGDVIFDYDHTSQCRGVRAPFSIIVTNEAIFYYATDKKFHRWNLLQDDIISESIFPETKEFDPNTDELIRGFEVSRRNQLRWFCPYGYTAKHNYVFVYYRQQKIPAVWEYAQADACCCMGSYRRQSDVYADDPVFGAQYADETAGFADDSSFLDNADIAVYGGWDGYVRIADSGLTTDDGSTFTRQLRLKRLNFAILDMRKRLVWQVWWLQAALSGEVQIKMRLDNKTSYEVTVKTISLVADDADKEIIKPVIKWNKTAQNFQPEIVATNHFAMQGVENFFFPRRKTYGP